MGPRISAPQRQSPWPPHIENRAEPKSAPKAVVNSNVQGVWESGVFRFNSPEAIEVWRRKAYSQGVSADNWHQGQEVDDKTRALAEADLGGPMPAMYQGPDGKHRFANIKTIEDKDVRDHRLAYIKGKTIDQIAAAKMPGEDEYIAKQKVTNDSSASEWKLPKLDSPYGPNSLGIFDPPTGEEMRERVEILKASAPKDSLLAKALIKWAEGASEVYPFARASVVAPLKGFRDAAVGLAKLPFEAGELVTGEKSSAPDKIDAVMPDARMENAGERIASVITQYAIPGAAAAKLTKVAPLVRDLPKAGQYLASLSAIGAADAAVTNPTSAATLGDIVGGPTEIVPNDGPLERRAKVGLESVAIAPIAGQVAKAGIKFGQKLTEQAKELTSGFLQAAEKHSAEAARPGRPIWDLLPKSTDYYTQGQAQKLPPGIGMVLIQEKPPHNAAAARFERGASGQVMDIETQIPYKPGLRLHTPIVGGYHVIKFDGFATNMDHILFVERKRRIPWERPEGMQKLYRAFIRSREALKQNNAAAGGDRPFRLVYEIETEIEAARTLDLIIKTGNDDIISVRVGKDWDEVK